MEYCRDDSLLLIQQTPRFSVIVNPKEHGAAKSGRSVFLDINEPYTRRTIRTALQDRNFNVYLGPGDGMEPIKLPLSCCDFQWAEYERIDWESVLAGKHSASSYCIRKGISRKAHLAYYTKRHVTKNPDSLLQRSLPQTVIIDTWSVWEQGNASSREGLADVVVSLGTSHCGDNVNRRAQLDQCLKEAKSVMETAEQNCSAGEEEPVWILKGSTVNKGAGIFLVHFYEQLVDICWTEQDIREWVLQRYISNPLLLRGRKFHIRAYALAVSALQVYLSHDCLALCSGSMYHSSDTSNMFAHITNTAYQDLDPNFCEEKCVLQWTEHDIAPILLADGKCPTLASAKQQIATVFSDMDAITAELFRAFENEFGVFAPIDGCFEHYGLDFVVDENWRVYLLEVNPGPDFKQTGTRLQSVIDNLMQSTVDVALLGNTPPQVGSSVGCLQLAYQTQSRAAPRPGIQMRLS